MNVDAYLTKTREMKPTEPQPTAKLFLACGVHTMDILIDHYPTYGSGPRHTRVYVGQCARLAAKELYRRMSGGSMDALVAEYLRLSGRRETVHRLEQAGYTVITLKGGKK